MNKPLVSVVMVVRNADRFLAEAIESILGQTFTEFEFIIVDFGSSDNSKPIISRYAAMDPRVKLHEISNCSLGEARNAGSSLAQGQYIAMMDADDIAVPERLMWQIEFMLKSPRVGLLGGEMEWIDATGKSLFIGHLPRDDREIRSNLTVRNCFAQPTVLIRKEAFTLVGGYRAVFAQAEDYDLWLRIQEHFDCANLGRVLLKYRIHSYQLTTRKRNQQTLCSLAARASALSRRQGNPDPLASVPEITPAVLTALGVSEATQQITATDDYLAWIRIMYMAGEYASALRTATMVLESSDCEHAERWQISELYLFVARLLWKERKFSGSVFAAGRAFITRPIMVGRPLKVLLRSLRPPAVAE